MLRTPVKYILIVLGYVIYWGLVVWALAFLGSEILRGRR